MLSPLNRKRLIIALALGFQLLFSRCYSADSPYVRVAITQDLSSLRLKIGGFYEVIDPLTHKILYRGKKLNTTVTVSGDGILLGDINLRLDRIFIKSDDPYAVMIDSRSFGGNIELIKKKNGRLSAVNHIALEDYIKGILYHETSHYWPPEALQAQAIVCRTYALYAIEENKSRDYDVTSDIYSQVYGGKASQRYRTNKAVDQTQGYALTYQGRLFPGYYHATCGGHTENASLLWKLDLAPLAGVVCAWCKESPHFKWHAVLPETEARDKLAAAGYKINKIKDIAVLGRDASGRITDLKIVSQNKDSKVAAKDFRNAVGPNVIRSTNFEVSAVSGDLVFEGLGWGHGVGLCQWGAYFMAKQGFNYGQILQYYYPGSEITVY